MNTYILYEYMFFFSIALTESIIIAALWGSQNVIFYE